jgi:hypothetical protein
MRSCHTLHHYSFWKFYMTICTMFESFRHRSVTATLIPFWSLLECTGKLPSWRTPTRIQILVAPQKKSPCLQPKNSDKTPAWGICGWFGPIPTWGSCNSFQPSWSWLAYSAALQGEAGVCRFSQPSRVTSHLDTCNTTGTGSFLFHSGKYVACPYWNINFSPLQHHSIQKCFLLQTSYYTTKVLRNNRPWSTVYNIQHNALVFLFSVSLSSRADIYNTWQDLLDWATADREVQQLFSRRH